MQDSASRVANAWQCTPPKVRSISLEKPCAPADMEEDQSTDELNVSFLFVFRKPISTDDGEVDLDSRRWKRRRQQFARICIIFAHGGHVGPRKTARSIAQLVFQADNQINPSLCQSLTISASCPGIQKIIHEHWAIQLTSAGLGVFHPAQTKIATSSHATQMCRAAPIRRKQRYPKAIVCGRDVDVAFTRKNRPTVRTQPLASSCDWSPPSPSPHSPKGPQYILRHGLSPYCLRAPAPARLVKRWKQSYTTTTTTILVRRYSRKAAAIPPTYAKTSYRAAPMAATTAHTKGGKVPRYGEIRARRKKTPRVIFTQTHVAAIATSPNRASWRRRQVGQACGVRREIGVVAGVIMVEWVGGEAADTSRALEARRWCWLRRRQGKRALIEKEVGARANPNAPEGSMLQASWIGRIAADSCPSTMRRLATGMDAASHPPSTRFPVSAARLSIVSLESLGWNGESTEALGVAQYGRGDVEGNSELTLGRRREGGYMKG
ncbi:hypothetical protein R3P38DRAFT_2776636 [Favolaschia claudopus]|uniref:Uncharacterized protein n=1 Tax=Favolaschia claudopus TaxID=2862362 RepID=A0AAW0BLZ1_9AGAR